MSRIVEGIFVIEQEPSAECSECGKTDECRPYGKDGALICYPCAMLPENRARTDAAIDKRLDGAKAVCVGSDGLPS